MANILCDPSHPQFKPHEAGILAGGLRSSRNDVHLATQSLSSDLVLAGYRKESREIQLTVDIRGLLRDGFPLVLTQHRVILCPAEIHRRYIINVKYCGFGIGKGFKDLTLY